MGLRSWLVSKISNWLIKDRELSGLPICDFERISYEIKPGDVLLIEGRSHVSDVIKNITQSPWTHAALYIGRLHDIEDPILCRRIREKFDGAPGTQLLIEAILGEGTIVVPLEKYRVDHVRICRPHGISRIDVNKVIAYAVNRLGSDYDVRQLLDLARFMFPYGILPRRWRSSLFQHNAGAPTRTVCSSLIAAAFASVHFPIMPVIQKTEDGKMRLFRRNERLYTPKDFDYSPYFDIIKYPFLGFEDLAIYRKLPWDNQGRICDDDGECYLPGANTEQASATADHKATPVPEHKSNTGAGPALYYPTSNLAINLLKEEIAQKHKK